MKSVTLVLGLLALASVLGCRSLSGDDNQRAVAKSEIAVALKSFLEAFGNGDAATLPGLLSKDCTAGDVRQLQSLSQLLHSASLGGRLEVTVNTDSFVVAMKGNRATIPIDQPEGALSATETVGDQSINGVPVQGGTGPVEQPLASFHAAPVFVREGSVWKIDNCGELFRHGDETP